MTKNQVRLLIFAAVVGVCGLIASLVALRRHGQYIKHVPESVRRGEASGLYDATTTNHVADLRGKKKLTVVPCRYEFVTAKMGDRIVELLTIDGRRLRLGDWHVGFRIISADERQAFGVGPDGLAIFHPRGAKDYAKFTKQID